MNTQNIAKNSLPLNATKIILKIIMNFIFQKSNVAQSHSDRQI
jgi:hypothetical protein